MNIPRSNLEGVPIPLSRERWSLILSLKGQEALADTEWRHLMLATRVAVAESAKLE
ncbi:MAG TPA: hypothetical protein VGG82_08710 [Casimicrobiaceae bacterium]